MAFPSTDNPNLTRFDREGKWNILIEISDHSKFWSTQLQTSMSGNDFANTYADEITKFGLGVITRRINSIGGFSTVSDFSFNILNQEMESDFLSPSVFFENDGIEISAVMFDGTDLVYAERIKLFVGVVNQIDFNENDMIINGVDLSRQEDEIIPRTTIDLVTFPVADSPDVSRPIQVIFGDFSPALLTDSDVSYVFRNYQNYFTVAPTTGLVDRSIQKHLLSERELNVGVSTALIFKYVPELNVFISLSGTVASTITAPSSFSLSGTIEGNFVAKPTLFHEDDPGDVTDISGMLSDLHSDSTSIGDAAGALEQVVLKFQGFSDPGDLTNSQTLTANVWQDISVVIVVDSITGSGGARLRYIISPGVGEETMQSDLTANTTNTRRFRDDEGAPDFPTTAPTFDQLRNMGFVIEVDTNTVAVIKHMFLQIDKMLIYLNPIKKAIPPISGSIREIQKTIVNPILGQQAIALENSIQGTDLLGQAALFAQIEGAEYGSWITGRQSRSSGDLIESPVGMIEYIARNYGGLADADIDETAFDTANTDTSGFTFAGIFDNPRNWVQAIAEIASQCKSRVYFDNEGLLTITVYNATADFTQSGSGTPDETGATNGESDVYIDEDTATGAGRYNNHLIERGSFRYRRTNVEEIVNEVYVNYFMNYGTNRLQKQTFVTDTNSDDGTGTRDQNTTAPNDRESVASTSKTNYKKTQRLDFNAPFIRDDATAVLLRNHLFDLQVDFRGIINFTTFYSALHLQLGDIINIQHPFLTNVVTGVTTKKWEVTSLVVDLDAMRIDIEAMELV